MEKTINIKFDKEQLEELVRKVTENIKKETETKVTTIKYKEPKKLSRLYLEANEKGLDSELKRVYWGYIYNTLSSESATEFNSKDYIDRNKVEILKSQGWKEEVFYK